MRKKEKIYKETQTIIMESGKQNQLVKTNNEANKTKKDETIR